MNEIPKIIHFIWAGGEKIMPESALQNVINWAKANPDFQVKIWVDELTDPDAKRKYKEKLQELAPPIIENKENLQELASSVRENKKNSQELTQSVIEDDKEKLQVLTPSTIENIELTDINQADICTPEVRYEINHLAPNYGASSDLLRYNILSKEGGAYFDCGDVFPNPALSLGKITFPEGDVNAGEPVFDQPLRNHRLLIHVTPHVMHDPSKDTKAEAPGTEAIICTPNNPLMKSIANKAHQAYHKKGWNYKLLKYQHNYDKEQASPSAARASRLSNSQKVVPTRAPISPGTRMFHSDPMQLETRNAPQARAWSSGKLTQSPTRSSVRGMR